MGRRAGFNIDGAMHARELDASTQILAVTERIYAAALDPAEWPAALALA